MRKKADKGVSKARKVWGMGKKGWKWLQTRGEHAEKRVLKGYTVYPPQKKRSKKKRKRRRRR